MHIYKIHFLKRPENIRFSELPSTLENFFQKRPFLGVKFSKNTHIWQHFFLDFMFMPLSHRDKHKIKFARFHFFMRAGARVRNNEISPKLTKNGHFSTFSKKNFDTNCDFLTQTHPGQAKNDKTNFVRRQLFMRADARVRFFEKFTKNGHFSTFSKKFFATNCDFLILTHPGDAMNHKTNFARCQFNMRRVRFFF